MDAFVHSTVHSNKLRCGYSHFSIYSHRVRSASLGATRKMQIAALLCKRIERAFKKVSVATVVPRRDNAFVLNGIPQLLQENKSRL